MELADHVGNDERVLHQGQATLRSFGSVEGQLGCTAHRILFVTESGHTEIALKNVVALEFRQARFPLMNAVIGVVFSVIGGFLLLVAYGGAGRPVTTVLGAIGLLFGVVTLAVGLRNRAATVTVHTTARSFEFAGEEPDLSAFTTAIRRSPAQPGGSIVDDEAGESTSGDATDRLEGSG